MNGGAGKKANLDIVGGGEGSVAGGRGHGWGADLANGTERCFDSRGTTAALLPFTEACAWLHLAVLLHAPRGERGRGRAVAPAVEEDAGSRAGASARRPGTSGGSSGGSEGREEREGVSVGGERGRVES